MGKGYSGSIAKLMSGSVSMCTQCAKTGGQL